MKCIFNTYDEHGYRRNINGNRTSQTEDNAIEYNLRHAWKEQLIAMTDKEVVDAYDLFTVDVDDEGKDYRGNNDERFGEWLANRYPLLSKEYL